MTITRDMLKTIELLKPWETDELEYKKHPFADLVSVATPQALLIRAKLMRKPIGVHIDVESTAAHLELAAETISELAKYL